MSDKTSGGDRGLEAALSWKRGALSIAFEVALPARGVTALLGPSGAGKTSCLRAIAGLDRLAVGRLSVGDQTWQDSERRIFLPPHRRRVGYVTQEPGLFTHLDVSGNLDFGWRRAGRPARLDREALIDQFGLRALLGRRVEMLSGGERQRVAIVRALLSDPAVLLFDEPLSALDVPAREDLLWRLEALHAKLAAPLIYVSHAIDEVTRLADHVVLLDAGRIVAQGPPRTTLARLDPPPAPRRPLQTVTPESDLISVAEAEALIVEHMPSFGVERVALDSAVGRVLRRPVYAERDHPPFDRVMMDGIGVRWSDPASARFALVGAQMAGMGRLVLQAAGTCLDVTTGAIVPEGCDCIIPIEQTRRDEDGYVLADGYRPAKGQFIHPRGSDCRAGAQVLDSGVRLGPPEMAQLAANGVARVEVATSPSIAIVATGDELVGVDAPLGEGQIRRSNDLAIAAALRGHGFDHVALSHVADDLAATTDALAALLAEHDVVIVSGGVSMGQRDYVPQALAVLGVRRVFHRIAQRPGKPMWFGTGPGRQVVFALPGNPVSSLVCAVRYVRPALLAAMGLSPDAPDHVCLGSDVETNRALTCFVPVHVRQDQSGRSMAHPVVSRTSGDFSTLARAHGVVQLPAGRPLVRAGEVAVLYRW